MPSELKTMMAAELKQRFEQMKDFAVFDNSGLSAEQACELRAKLHENGASILVVKNSMLKYALPSEVYEGLSNAFSGQTAVAYGDCDAPVILKAMLDWAKDNGHEIDLKGGHIEGRTMESEDLKEVAKLPSEEVLRSQLLATITAPMTDLLRLLNEPRRRMVAILEQKAKEGQAGE